MLEELYPDVIDAKNFKYIKVDNQYILTMCIYALPSEITSFKILNMLPKDIEYSVSMHVVKQDTLEALRKISSSITNNELEFKDLSKSNLNKDIIEKVKEDAKKLRYEMQINNQEIYNVYIFLKIKSKEKETLLQVSEIIKNNLITKMLKVNILNFRHLFGYLSCIPAGCYNKEIFSNYFINMTTSNLITLFPFYTNAIIHKNGILYGKLKEENSLCIIDFFDLNNLNSNMCIFGSSGSGKSYFTKLLILRNYLKNIKQYVIDPEGEYTNLPGQVVDVMHDKINLLEIYKHEICENFLDNKVIKILNFLGNIVETNEMQEKIKEALYNIYYDKGITNDIETLYENKDVIYLNKKMKSSKEFPTVSDLIQCLIKVKKYKIEDSIIKKIKDKFEKEYSFLNGITTVNIYEDILVFDISKIKSNDEVCNYMINFINELIEINKSSLIYIDEVWKLIRKNNVFMERIFELYKTIRKRKAGIITITQDITDILNNEYTNFGKSIINNSYIKMFFKMEYQETEILNSIGILKSKDIEILSKLDKKEGLSYFNNSSVHLKIEANELEKNIIEGVSSYDNCSSK